MFEEARPGDKPKRQAPGWSESSCPWAKTVSQPHLPSLWVPLWWGPPRRLLKSSGQQTWQAHQASLVPGGTPSGSFRVGPSCVFSVQLPYSQYSCRRRSGLCTCLLPWPKRLPKSHVGKSLTRFNPLLKSHCQRSPSSCPPCSSEPPFLPLPDRPYPSSCLILFP